MQLTNSYIFIEREKKKPQVVAHKDKNVISINFTPSLAKIMEDAFSNVTIIKKDKFIHIGTFEINVNGKIKIVNFKAYNVSSNYYVDITTNEKYNTSNIKLLEEVDKIFMNKENIFDKHYISVKSYDVVSQYYCNKLFPYLNEFERKLRKLMFNVYIVNFNDKYYSKTSTIEFQNALKGNVKKQDFIDVSNISKEDKFLKYGFYSLDYNEISTLLFTPTNFEEDEIFVKEKLEKVDNLSALSDEEIRMLIDKSKSKTDWERFFGNKKIDKNFHQTFESIRVFRNNVAHCKFIDKDRYNECLSILKKVNKSLDSALEITVSDDFIAKNYELSMQSMATISESLGKFARELSSMMAPFNELINQQLEQTREFSRKLGEIVISSIPKFELPKYDLLSMLDKDTENIDKK